MGGTTTTTSNGTQKPWPAVEAPLKDIALAGANMAASGVGGGVFPGSRVAPLSIPTQAAMLGAYHEATQGDNLGKPLIGAFQQGITSGGISPYQRQAASIAQTIADQSSGPNANPYFESALQDQLSRAADKVNSYFSAAGRYGSGAHTDTLARTLGGLRAQTLYSQFNQDRSRALAASGQLANIGSAGAANLINMARTAPAIDRMRFADFERLMNIGSNIQNYQQRLMDEARGIWNEQQNAPWQQVLRAQGITNPIAAQYGTKMMTSTTTKPWNPLSLMGAPLMLFGAK